MNKMACSMVSFRNLGVKCSTNVSQLIDLVVRAL